MRESDLGSLQLPELCDLIQKVELNPSEGLTGRERTMSKFRNIICCCYTHWTPQGKIMFEWPHFDIPPYLWLWEKPYNPNKQTILLQMLYIKHKRNRVLKVVSKNTYSTVTQGT